MLQRIWAIQLIKNVFAFWGISLLISILLFVAYRIVISQTKTVDGNSFEKWMQIFEIILNLGFSLVYLIIMIISSFAVLLNFNRKIRNNFYFSLLTFLGIPSFCAIIVFIDIQLKTVILFSIIYLVITLLEFLVFRKIINKSKPE